MRGSVCERVRGSVCEGACVSVCVCFRISSSGMNVENSRERERERARTTLHTLEQTLFVTSKIVCGECDACDGELLRS